ncbi:MAG TPA: ATP-binding protein [Caulifigura sp.]|nr:ATP-binding protein [Caulifigura sp.]
MSNDSSPQSPPDSILQDREALTSGLLGSITDGLYSLRSDWRIAFANDEIVRRFGRPRDEILGQKLWELFADAEGNEAYVGLHRAMADRATVEYEIYYEPWGRWFADKAFPTADGGLAVFSRDITDRKQAEQAMRASEEKYRTLFESIDEGFCIIEFFDGPHGPLSDYVHVEANQAYTTNAGIPDIVGQKVREMVPDEADAWVEIYRNVLVTGKPVRFERELVATGRHLELAAFRVEPAERRQVAVLFKDVTERKKSAEALREADRMKDEFLATLAHELRNPLAPIRNGLQIIKLAHNDPETVEECRSMMDRQVTQMTRLIDDLMDVSRVSRGKISLQKTRLLLADAIQDAVETARPFIEERAHELVVNMPPEPIYVDADRTRLAQVFANLLNNAAKYTDRQGRIRVTVERQESDVVILIDDNGVGIPITMQSKIFDIFTQVDRSLEKSQGGLGIGLAIVKKLLDMHDGSITVESRGHRMGSRFTVRLPVVLSIAGETVSGETDDDAREVRRRRILIVDDNPDGARSLATMLTMLGNQTRVAHDGREAVGVAESFRPHVILMDIGMPGLNGYEACRRIRQQPWGKSAVIVACTGWGQEEDRRQSAEAGFDAHMVKPLAPADLEKLLAEVSSESA